MRIITRRRIYLTIQVVIFTAIGMWSFQGHPPAGAQSRVLTGPVVPVLTVEDAVQDQKLIEANDHLSHNDDQQLRLWAKVNSTSDSITSMQGEERGIGAGLALLQIASIVFNWNKRKAEDAD